MKCTVAGCFFMTLKILHRAWEAQTIAYCMYFLELKEPSGDKQLMIDNFAGGADGKQPNGDGDAAAEE
jgi:hypothetical protein